MKKYKIAATLLFIIALLSILFMQSFYNLKQIVMTPSDMWGREIYIGTTSFRRDPIVSYSDNKLDIIYVGEENIKKVSITDSGEIIESLDYMIEGFDTYRLVKYSGDKDNFLWTENDVLFYCDISRNALNPRKIKLSEGINDFIYTASPNGKYVIAAKSDGLFIYRLENGQLFKAANEYKINKPYKLSCTNDSKDNIHIAFITDEDITKFKVHYIAYDIRNSLWSFPMTSNEERSFGHAGTIENLSNIDIGLDKENIYILYELQLSSANEPTNKIFIGSLPVNHKESDTLKFKRIIMSRDNKELPDAGNVRLLKSDGENVHLMLSAEVQSSPAVIGNELIFAEYRDDKIISENLATINGKFNTPAAIINVKGGLMAVYLQVAGDFDYNIRLTGSSRIYKNAVNSIKVNDVYMAVINTIPGYMYAIILTMIRTLIFFPAVLWPIIVEILKLKPFFGNTLLTFNISVFIETIMKLWLSKALYTPQSILFMPDIMKFSGAKYFYTFLIGVIAYIIVYLYKKGREDIHVLPITIMFVVLDSLLVYMLYAAYLYQHLPF